MSYKKILVGTDFSDSSLEAIRGALTIAQTLGAHLEIVHVCNHFEDNIPPFTNKNPVADGKTYRQLIEENLQNSLNQQIEKAGAKGKSFVHSHFHFGNPKNEMLAHMKTLKPDLFVLGFHGHHFLSKLFIGSVASQMMISAPCDVLVIKNSMTKTPTNLFAGIDTTSLSAKIFDRACGLAKAFKASLHLETVLEPNPEIYYALTQVDGIGAVTGIQEALEAEKKKAQTHLDSYQKKAKEAGISVNTKIKHAKDFKTASSLVQSAKEAKADLLIMGAHSKNKVDQFLFGSVAKEVVNLTTSNILITK